MKTIWQTIDNVIRKAGPYVPFYLSNTILRNLDTDGHSILDVGCGWGEPMMTLPLKHNYTVGADIFMPDLKEAQLNKTHNEYVLCNVRQLPFKENSFDIVLCMEVIEHFEKGEAIKLIEELEKIARMHVIITTPVGFLQQDPSEGNPHQEHKSGFYPIEFKKLGYKVRGFGVKISWWLTLPHSYYQKSFRRFLRVIFSPFSYYFPRLGERMICTKKMVSSSNEEPGR